MPLERRPVGERQGVRRHKSGNECQDCRSDKDHSLHGRPFRIFLYFNHARLESAPSHTVPPDDIARKPSYKHYLRFF